MIQPAVQNKIKTNRPIGCIKRAAFCWEVKIMSPEKKIRVSADLARDPNYIAYQAALTAGQFESMETGTFVAYHEGQLVGSGMDRDKLFQELHEQGIEGFFFHQVGVPERVVHLRSPHIVRRG